MIEIKNDGKLFVLHTKNTTYAFSLLETGQLEHIYYGKRIPIIDERGLKEKHFFGPGNTVAYDNDHTAYTLEDMCLEYSGYGKGDIREPFVEVVCADGSTTTDFVFEGYEVLKGKDEIPGLPSSYDESGETDHLIIRLKDVNHGFHLELHYYTFEDCDVITRRSVFINDSGEKVSLRRLMSMQLDVNKSGLKVSTFNGGWTKEMQKRDTVVSAGTFVNSSFTGSSSNRSNPFFMVSRADTTEDAGICMGFNLVYSGNHYSCVDVNSFEKSRILSGINPRNFAFLLEPDEEFCSPEAVLCFSEQGYTGMSHRMHAFVREHIVRGVWKYKERPVLLNSWEANYFDIDEGKLLALAKKAKEVGVELFVMDDGWFGERNDDKRALGDWEPNLKKLPGGLSGICDKVNALGLDFGIWVEPEMVNVDSDLYRAHPNWSMEIPGMNHSEGRNQRILDFANPEVVSYMTEQMKKVFSSANISYVKWDMNRIFSDYYSQYLPAERQQEVAHRYMMGVYRMMKDLTESFPEILFEGCAAGGNRFDLGILSYFPQIWGSDNTDAVSRLRIQNGYSYGYPMSTVTAHVSSVPNHQTLRVTPLDARYAVAAYGVLGYECNLCDMKKEDLEAIREQIEQYKKHRACMQFGDFYRGRAGNVYEWTVVSRDQKEAVGMVMQREVYPNEMYENYHAKGLSSDVKYHFYSMPLKHNVKVFGDLINTASPIHIKQDSFMHHMLAKLVKMDEKGEDFEAYGEELMSGGVRLSQSFVGTGFDDNVRVMTDFSARLYYMEERE